MKIKEIIKDKWGWAVAVLGGLYSLATFKGYTPLLGLPNLIPTTCTGALGCGYTSAVYSNAIYFVIIGFILGLILHKLWRKFQ